MVERIRFALERFASPRHRSHVAQLSTLGGITLMKPIFAILLTALLTLSFFFGFRIGDVGISFGWFIVLGTGIWAAVDSTKIQLKRYKSGISYGPVVILICFVGLWIVAFPWYLILRYKIKTGTAILKDGVTNVAA